MAFPKFLDLDFPALTTEVNDFVRNRVMESMTSTLRELKAELQNLETSFSFDNIPTQTPTSSAQQTQTQALSLRVRELEAQLKQVTKKKKTLPVPSKNVRRGTLRQHNTRPSQARPQPPSPRRRALLPTPLLAIPFPQTQQVHRQLSSTHFTVHLLSLPPPDLNLEHTLKFLKQSLCLVKQLIKISLINQNGGWHS